MPNYTGQLYEIWKAMSQPPAWIIAISSAALGLIAGLIGSTLQIHIAEYYRRDNMRRVLYLDLINMFLTVDTIINFKEITDDNQKWKWQEGELQSNLRFRGEKHCMDNLNIYMQLPERMVGEVLYQNFHLILDGSNWMVNTNLALRLFANSVHSGHLCKKQIRRFLSQQQAVNLLNRVEYYQQQDDELCRQMNLPRQPTNSDGKA